MFQGEGFMITDAIFQWMSRRHILSVAIYMHTVLLEASAVCTLTGVQGIER